MLSAPGSKDGIQQAVKCILTVSFTLWIKYTWCPLAHGHHRRWKKALRLQL